MIRPLATKLILGVACLIFIANPVAAASVDKTIKKQAKSELKDYRVTVEKLKRGEKLCDYGARSIMGGIITRVSDLGLANGLQPGDKVLALDGVAHSSSDDYEAYRENLSAGDSIVLTVERNGSPIDLNIVCPDGTERARAAMRMLKAASKDKWQECFDYSYQFDRLNGGPIAWSAWWRTSCNDGQKCGRFTGCDFSTGDYRLVYEQHRLQIEEATIANDLERVRSSVLSSITWLEENSAHRFARELESLLQKAEAGPPPSVAKRVAPSQPKVAYGTCFAVSDSEVLTSHHIVANSNLITVRFQGGVETGAIVTQKSQSTDLAVLKIGGSAPAILPLAPMRSLNVGEEVFTIGYPVTVILGSEAKFTEGSVSSLSGIQGDASYFQMSVPIQPGNSGGPVVNMRGEVVGIVASTAAIEAFYTVSGSLPQSVNWASKSDYARLMFEPPAIEKRASSRAEAIELTNSAICQVKAVNN